MLQIAQSRLPRPLAFRAVLLWLILLTVAAHAAHVCGSVPSLGGHGTLPGSTETSGPCLLCLTLQAAFLVCLVILGEFLLRAERVVARSALGRCFTPYLPPLFVRPPPAR